MSFWTAIVALAAIGTLGLASIAYFASKKQENAGDRLGALEDRLDRMEADMHRRVEVLERIVTEGKDHLKREFENL